MMSPTTTTTDQPTDRPQSKLVPVQAGLRDSDRVDMDGLGRAKKWCPIDREGGGQHGMAVTDADVYSKLALV